MVWAGAYAVEQTLVLAPNGLDYPFSRALTSVSEASWASAVNLSTVQRAQTEPYQLLTLSKASNTV